ncbi:uncharacterized protein LOC141640765 [Silene latifolia]|uniref:uncharacterized protein LOC141640765 n=1 Tax=Silene latifolia TaxID=37657 RepID=UPI003D786CBF
MGAKKRPASQRAAAAEPEHTDTQEEEVREIDPPARAVAFKYQDSPLQDLPRVISPEIVQAQKRKREDDTLAEEEGEKQPIPAQPIRSIRQVPARIDDMDDARARIDEFSAKMSNQLLSASTLESSTRVVSILTSLVTRAAELASQAREGLDAGLATACQLRDAQARVSSLEEKLDKLNRDLHTSRGNEVVLNLDWRQLRSQPGLL